MAFKLSDMSSLNRKIRNLGHQKTSRTFLGEGIPSESIGDDGDFRLHTTDNGVKLYAKYKGQWYGFVPEDKQSDEVDVVAATAVVGDSDNTEILADVAAIRTTVNSLLAKLRIAGIIKERIKD